MTPTRSLTERAGISGSPPLKRLPAGVVSVVLLALLAGRSTGNVAAQSPARPAPSDPKLVYGALNSLLEYQRRFFERRMIDPSFLTRFNDLVRANDFGAAATYVGQAIGVTGAVVVVDRVGSGAARICFGVAGLTTCSEWK